MGMAFWFTVQVGSRRIPIPLLIVLPLLLLLDILAFLLLVPYGIWKKERLFLDLGSGFVFTRLTLGLILHGGGFRIRVRDGKDRVLLGGGWLT